MNIRKCFPLFFAWFFLAWNSYGQNLGMDWVVPIAGSGSFKLVTGVAVDKNNNAFAVGPFNDTIVVRTKSGTTQLISQGETDMFVAKIAPDGIPMWVKQVGGKNRLGTNGNGDLAMNHWFSIALDESGNLYITGNYRDTVDFDPGPGQKLLSSDFYLGGSLPGQSPPMIPYVNSFILKLDNNGEFVWVKTLHGNENSSSGIAYDAQEGTIAVCGYFRSKVDFNDKKNIDTLRATSSKEVFVVKYDTTGEFVWARQMGRNAVSSRTSEALGIHIDGQGNILTTGIFSDSADFDPDPRSTAYLVSTAKPGQNIFISKLDKDGKYVWAKAIGAINYNTSSGPNSRGTAITTDASGNVFTTGFVSGSVVGLDPGNLGNTLTPFSNLTTFISKLDANGNYLWGKLIDQPRNGANHSGLGIQADNKGDVYAAGYFSGEVYFDPDRAKPERKVYRGTASSTDAFLVKWTSSGDFVWARQVESTNASRGMALHLASNLDLYMGGFYSGTAEFNPGGTSFQFISNAPYQAEGFVMKLVCTDTTSASISREVCGNSFEFLGTTYEVSGKYVQVIANAAGCDSTITLDLTLLPVPEPVITVKEFVLGVSSKYASYQWIFNDQPIPGATDSVYHVTANGQYRVAVVTEDGCKDTSEVYTVDNVTGIGQQTGFAHQIRIYPNPSSDLLYIDAPVEVDVRIIGVEGKLHLSEKSTNKLSVKNLAVGIYFVNLFDSKGNLLKVEKLYKL